MLCDAFRMFNHHGLCTGMESSMSVQIEQKSYEMPPKEGMSIAHFLTVGDINRTG